MTEVCIILVCLVLGFVCLILVVFLLFWFGFFKPQIKNQVLIFSKIYKNLWQVHALKNCFLIVMPKCYPFQTENKCNIPEKYGEAPPTIK